MVDTLAAGLRCGKMLDAHKKFLEELKEFIRENCYENDYGVHIIDEGMVIEKIKQFQAEQKVDDE